MKPDLDAADIRLLGVLQRDASLTIADIGQRIHLSINACWRRIKRLEDLGYILRRVAVLDPGKLGLGVSAFVTVTLDAADVVHVASAREALLGSELVTEVHQLSGENAYLLRVHAVDGAALNRWLNEVSATAAPRSIDVRFVLNTLRQTSALPLSGATPPR